MNTSNTREDKREVQIQNPVSNVTSTVTSLNDSIQGLDVRD